MTLNYSNKSRRLVLNLDSNRFTIHSLIRKLCFFIGVNFFFFGLLFTEKTHAQNYDHILNYASNSLPINGVKIKTNMPFTPATQMPTINITGYNYGGSEPINLTLTYYIYSSATDWNNPLKYYFHFPMITSSGSYTPIVQLANEGGKVVIYINDRSYFQRFTISVYANGIHEVSSWFQGWTAVDEPLTGTAITEVPYRNRFKGDIFLSGNGIWNTQGNVGIGTISPTEKLSVNGKIRAHEIKVETQNWPDYVFADDYKLSSLQEVAAYIKKNKHLPEVPSADSMIVKGIELGEMNKLLLKKIEELTLHLIKQNERLTDQEQRAKNQEATITQLSSKLKRIENIIPSNE